MKTAADLRNEDAEFVQGVTARNAEKVQGIYALQHELLMSLPEGSDERRLAADILGRLDGLTFGTRAAANYARKVATADYDEKASRLARRAERRAQARALNA